MAISAGMMLDILKDEKEVFCELVKLSNIEQEYILENNIDGLLELSIKKERLALAVRELEKKRTILLNNSHDVKQNETSKLRNVAESFDSSSADEADALRGELLSVMEEFGHINHANGELLKRSFDYVTFMLDTILPDENPTYSNKNTTNNVSPRLFDGKA